VSISAAAIERPEVISEISDAVGRQSVVVVIDAKKRLLGDYEAWTHNGRRNSKRNAIEFAAEAAERGAGEIVLNSIDRDGSMKGYDLTLAKRLRTSVRVPITILGGAGSLDDISGLIEAIGTAGAAAGSLFVFKGAFRAVLINYPAPEAKERLFSARAAA
jgi:cyclase